MADTNTTEEIQEDLPPISNENFAELLDESFGDSKRVQGRVITGTVIAVQNSVLYQGRGWSRL